MLFFPFLIVKKKKKKKSFNIMYCVAGILCFKFLIYCSLEHDPIPCSIMDFTVWQFFKVCVFWFFYIDLVLCFRSRNMSTFLSLIVGCLVNMCLKIQNSLTK
jgi:hypothetical protein